MGFRPRQGQGPAGISFGGSSRAKNAVPRRGISFSCSTRRIRFLASRSSAASFSVTPGMAPSSISAFEPYAGLLRKFRSLWRFGKSGFVLPCNSDYVAAELSGEALGILIILAARNESSQVRSQANPGQSLVVVVPATVLTMRLVVLVTRCPAGANCRRSPFSSKIWAAPGSASKGRGFRALGL